MPVNLLEPVKSFGVKPGLKRIVSIEWMVHQYPPNKTTGKESEPFCCLAVGYLPVDENGKALDEAEVDYTLRVGPKWGRPLAECQFAPATEPGKPLPLRVGSRGPYIEPVGNQSGLSEKSKPWLWIEALQKIGGSKFTSKLSESQMNIGVLVGTEGEIYELNSHNEGLTDEGTAMKDTKIGAFKSIIKFGWEQPAGYGATNGTASAANGSTSAATSGDTIDKAIAFLKKASEIHKTKNKMPLEDLIKGAMPIGSKMEPRLQGPQRDAVKKLISEAEFWENDAVADVAVYDPSSGEVEFNRS
jgi:hypothetical protein